MRNPRRTWIAALALAVPLIAGCGGGGEDETTESAPVTTEATTALTKAELLERGDAICAEVNAAVGTVSANAEGGEVGQVAGLYSGMIASINGLGMPQETTGYTDFSAVAEALASAEDEVELAAERGDVAALEAAESSASSALAEFQAAAGEYGFEECSEGPSVPVAATPETGEVESGETPEAVEPEAEPEPEVEATPEPAPETGGAGGTAEEGAGGGTGGGETGAEGGGDSGGIGPG